MRSRRGNVKEVGGAKVYRAWKEWDAGDVVEGIYEGTSTDNYGKDSYHVRVKFVDFKDKKAEFKEDVVVGLNHNGALSYKFSEIEEGTYVIVEYEGKTTLPKNHKYAGKESHQVKVMIAEDEPQDSVESADDLDNI